jgi:hypothetical protein
LPASIFLIGMSPYSRRVLSDLGMLASDSLARLFAIPFFYTATTGLSAIRAQRTRCLLCILVILPFAFYSDERVLFVFGICFLHLELEGSMRDSSLLLLCVYSKSSFLRLFSASLLPSVNCYISLI